MNLAAVTSISHACACVISNDASRTRHANGAVVAGLRSAQISALNFSWRASKGVCAADDIAFIDVAKPKARA